MPSTEDLALQGDDILLFEDESVTARALSQTSVPWRVLVVDDEEDVFMATAFSLRDSEIDGRGLELLQATSARQALELIAHEPNIAVVLLDVVMETPDAGLRLVERIRAMPGREPLRIILRTGQPGYAPELDVIKRYDINDYKTKSELTQGRLMACLTVAVRGYHQLVRLQAHQRGLEKVVSASGTLVTQRHSLQSFAEGVLTQICDISECQPQGVVVLRKRERQPGETQGQVVAAAGVYRDLVGESLNQLPEPVQQCFAQQLGGAVGDIGGFKTVHIRSSGGDELVVLLTAQAPLNDVTRHMLEVFAINISLGLDNVQVFQELEHLAHHDVETGLRNRLGFRRGLSAKGAWFAQVQIDELEDIRGTLGEQVTNQLIAEVGRRLEQGLGEGGRVARINGDRIALAVPGSGGDALRQRVLDLLSQPVAVAGVEVRLPIAIGWSEGAASVTQAVDEAGLVVSRLPTGRQLRCGDWTPALADEVRQRVRLLSDLQDALAEDRIEMFLQPQLRLLDERVMGAEALVRWRRRDGTLVLPAEFIPMAEQTGAIRSLGERVAEKAVLALASWADPVHRISVNVSIRQLEETGFADWLHTLCQRHGVANRRLRLEITESAFAQDHSQVQDTLAALVSHGFELSIDDFGTGHSSLGRLVELRFQELKIDRSLVCAIETDARARKLAAMIVELGRDLGVEVLAEGLETPGQLLQLRDMGCVLGQGWLYGHAMPQADYEFRHGLA
ncbi:EAL domain-containing response regulator [Hydrogenophaga sp. OTU3427]|uniref:EAL domain-containing response regulator n=1 Tax=Hydrogenophaga sp. OTU3427 TaxID=3043856 RepID=UPI00313A8A75